MGPGFHCPMVWKRYWERKITTSPGWYLKSCQKTSSSRRDSTYARQRSRLGKYSAPPVKLLLHMTMQSSQSLQSKWMPTLGYNPSDFPWTNDQLPKTFWAPHILWTHMFWAAYWDTSVAAPLLQYKSWPPLHWKQSSFLASPLMELELCTSIINQFMCSNKLERILVVPLCLYQHWMLYRRPIDSIASGLFMGLI